MKKIRFGVIGPGKIANLFCGDLVQSQKAELYAVASRSDKRAAEFAKKYGADKIYSDYEKLAEDKNIDVVYIATPHVFHKDISIMCMERGKAVLCEKPAAVNEVQMNEIAEAAKKNDVFFMEGMWTKCFPITRQLKAITDSQKMGKIRHIDANFGVGSWDDSLIYDSSYRLFSPELAGGGILDIGIYPISLVSWLMGRAPEKITAAAKMTETGVDGDVIGILEYNDNCLAKVQCSICQETSETARIYFDEGKIEINRFYRPNHMEITYRDGTHEDIYDDYERKNLYGFLYEIDHVADCIRDGKKVSSYHSIDDSLNVVKIMDELRKQIGLKYPFE